MNKTIQKLAQKKLRVLTKKYSGINSVILDNWRGYRFIYDTADVRACRNDCKNCRLYRILKNEPDGRFTARLQPASVQDKRLFGPQNYLNCKTLPQYRQCYIHFFNKKIKTKKQYLTELALLNNLRILNAGAQLIKRKEKSFKRFVRNRVLPL
ncbi:MAG: hypothetical protein WC544_01685 [Patescibacteria group bacterium]